MTFGEFIAGKRKEKMLSQRSLALKIGTSPVYVSYFESGKRNPPSLRFLDRISEVLNLNEQEKNTMFFLATQHRYQNNVSDEMVLYLNENNYARDTLRLAKECRISDDDWQFITNYICNKYNL